MALKVKCRDYEGWLDVICEDEPQMDMGGNLYSTYNVQIKNGKVRYILTDVRAEEIEVYAV